MDISVVVPVYGCPSALPELHRRLAQTLSDLVDTYEIVLVYDCDEMGSWEQIVKICDADENVVGIELARNFGQIRAITAGLDHSSGDWVVVMDCDLQDRPEGIRDLYAKAQEGYDVVFARRKNRKDNKVVKFFSRSFYKVYDYFTDGNFDNSICNFSISKRVVIDAYCSMREQNRGYTLFIKWLGFKQAKIDIEADKRFAGESSYSMRKKIAMAFELITSQSNKPLRLSVSIGSIIALLAFVYLIVLIIVYFANPGKVPIGWTSTVGSIFLMGGLILAALGVVGLYVGNIFNEVKNRPLYVVRSVIQRRH